MRPVHLCCAKDDTRRTLNYIQVFRNRVIATNGHIIIVLPVSEVFGENIIDPDEEFYFDAKEWKDSKFYKSTKVAREANKFIGTVGKKSVEIMGLTRNQFLKDSAGKIFPRYEVVFPTTDAKDYSPNLGIHPQALVNLAKCFYSNYVELKMQGPKENNTLPITVTNPNSQGIGLIVPIQTNLNNLIDIKYRLGVSKENWEELI